jgi:hypothetical protein
MAKQTMDTDPFLSNSGIEKSNRGSPPAHILNSGDSSPDGSELSRLRILLVEMMVKNQQLRENLQVLTGESQFSDD